jgi:hypothetical protein
VGRWCTAVVGRDAPIRCVTRERCGIRRLCRWYVLMAGVRLALAKRRTAGDVFDERIRSEIRTFENWRRQPELFSPLFWRFVEMVWWMREKKMDAVRPHQGLICKHGRYGSHPTLIFSEYPSIHIYVFFSEYLST